MGTLKRILLAEDDPKAIEIALDALAEYDLVNQTVVARDGVEVLDYLYRRGGFAERPDVRASTFSWQMKGMRWDG